MFSYCGWLQTPIGLRNRRFFLQFLSFGTLLCLFGAVANISASLSAASQLSFFQFSFPTRWLLAFVDLLAGAWLGHFAVENWIRAGRSRTTVGELHGPNEDAFDLGDTMRNLEQVFGPRPAWQWTLPRLNGGPLLDGYTWPTSQSEGNNLKAV